MINDNQADTNKSSSHRLTSCNGKFPIGRLSATPELIELLFIFLVCIILMIACVFAGHEIGFMNGQIYEKKQQGYNFQEVRSAFMESK